MMNQETLFTFIGYLGTLSLAASFVVALTGLNRSSPGPFIWLNLAGGICLCFPTMLAQTPVSHILNAFWIAVALSALLEHVSNQRLRVPRRILKIMGLMAALGVILIVSMDLNQATLESTITALMGMTALICFMSGYFYMSTGIQQAKSLRLYLTLSMTGNLFYIPLLLQDQNMPLFWLQVSCFIAGTIKTFMIACVNKGGSLNERETVV